MISEIMEALHKVEFTEAVNRTDMKTDLESVLSKHLDKALEGMNLENTGAELLELEDLMYEKKASINKFANVLSSFIDEYVSKHFEDMRVHDSTNDSGNENDSLSTGNE